ncbi:MAG: class I SAM-dependent methyltransferase [Candidatus Micrarchaeota archaeon]|nr:class I SAM-dependent methyltransferase [Candidatus Micrarchaeota archaeon]
MNINFNFKIGNFIVNKDFIEYNETKCDDPECIKKKVKDFYNRYPFPYLNAFEIYEKNDTLVLEENKKQNMIFEKIVINKIHEKIMKTILASANMKPEELKNKRILDAGCGSGEKSIYCALHKANEVLGIDMSENSLKIANTLKNYLNVDNVHFENLELEKLNFENEFDLCMCIGVLHHIYEHEKVLNNLLKSLKRNGIIILGFYSFLHRIPYYLRKVYIMYKYKSKDAYIKHLKELYKQDYLVINNIDNYLHVYEKAFRITYLVHELEEKGFRIINLNDLKFTNCLRLLIQRKYFFLLAARKM